ncbi:MAG TPA: ABC transporter ATP-binding protein [Pyrinomonadaceae bacterium]
MNDLRLENVSKRYRIRGGAGAAAPGGRIGRRLRSVLRPPTQEFWAVRDVSFEVPRGEALGVIGHNGAGKSTILKLLSGITAPTAGLITIAGRLSALIEVGSGFHPELTGRENVFLSGSILGMRRREIKEKLDDIVGFAEVSQFIDTPVKRYSSGMYVRLGFAIAAHLDPDILLLDEVLAVGDAAFQQKCLRRIGELKRAGKTIVFISHDLEAVEGLCDRVLLMQRGRLVADGAPRDVIAAYQSAASDVAAVAPPGGSEANLSKAVEVTGLSFHDAEGRPTVAGRTGEPLTARVEYVARERARGVAFAVFFYADGGELQCQLSTELSGGRIDLDEGRGAVEFSWPELGLQRGVYKIDATVERHPETIDWKYQCATLSVGGGKVARGNFYAPHTWRLAEPVAAAGSREEEQLSCHTSTA